MSVFNMGKQFSTDPAGRFYKDGDGSGEEFREEYLRKGISELVGSEKLEIIMDDGLEDGYGSSFLTEGFAGMVKYGYIEADELLSKLKFSFSDEDYSFYCDRAIEYIEASKFDSEVYEPTEKVKKDK